MENDIMITVLTNGKIVRHVPLSVGVLRNLGQSLIEMADMVTLPPSVQIEKDTDEQEE